MNVSGILLISFLGVFILLIIILLIIGKICLSVLLKKSLNNRYKYRFMDGETPVEVTLRY